jgi:hypothetical protein
VVSSYGNTIWAWFYSGHWGRMQIETAGPFDSVIGLIPVISPDNPEPLFRFASCSDEIGGFQETSTDIVVPKQWYAVQIGGTGSTLGGPIQGKFELLKPQQVEGQAFLFWKLNPLRVTDMHATNVPRFETLSLQCTKGACKKRKINVKTKRAQPLGALLRSRSARSAKAAAAGGPSVHPIASTPASVFPPARETGRSEAKRPAAHAAAKLVKLLKNKKVKPGAKIVLRITRVGYIGKYYVWHVKKNGISPATIRCLNPSSNKPRKKCSG